MNTELVSESSAARVWPQMAVSLIPTDSQSAFEVRFPASTLPVHLRSAFLASLNYDVLRELGETAPFLTRLLVDLGCGLRELESTYDSTTASFALTARGPHAFGLAALLPSRVSATLARMTFDQDGFVVPS